ncbi:MAG: hypothetical protein FJX77_14885, partial [Armatimonadetes bacterium]|nr:hypothetical protein [Armatimonadota bacterium]
MSLAPMPTAVPNELDLRHYIHVLWRRRRTFLQMFLLVLALGLTSVVLQRPVFRTSARLMAPSSSIGAQIAINDGSSPIASLLGEVMPEELDAQVERLRSTPFREAVQKRAGPRARGVSLRVEGEMDSATITITAQGTDPEGCARAANAAAALHQERSRERQTAGLRNTLEFLQKQVAEAEGALQDADRRLQTASLARNADRPGREEAATRRSELRREVAAREQSVRAAEARRDAVRRRQAAPGVPSDSSLRVDRPVDERISILLRQRAA